MVPVKVSVATPGFIFPHASNQCYIILSEGYRLEELGTKLTQTMASLAEMPVLCWDFNIVPSEPETDTPTAQPYLPRQRNM